MVLCGILYSPLGNSVKEVYLSGPAAKKIRHAASVFLFLFIKFIWRLSLWSSVAHTSQHSHRANEKHTQWAQIVSKP